MEKASEKIIDILSKNNIIYCEDSDSRDEYIYVLYKSIMRIVFISAILLVGILAKKLAESLLFLLGTITIRANAGGCHANTSLGCLVGSVVSYALSMFLVEFLPMSYGRIVVLVLSAISALIIFAFAPAIHENEWCDEATIAKFRKNSRVLVVLIFLLSIIAMALDYSSLIDYALALSFGAFIAAMSVAIQYAINILRKEVKNEEE